MYFSFDFGCYSIDFDDCLLRTGGGDGGDLFNGQNLLSVMKVPYPKQSPPPPSSIDLLVAC